MVVFILYGHGIWIEPISTGMSVDNGKAGGNLGAISPAQKFPSPEFQRPGYQKKPIGMHWEGAIHYQEKINDVVQ